MPMDVSEIRRKNLRLVIEQQFAGTAAELARALGKQPSEISRIFSLKRHHRRNIGSRLARQIESILGKEAGWMDRQQFSSEDRAGAWTISDTCRRVPVMSMAQAKQAAVSGHFGFPEPQPQDWIIVTAPAGERAFALRVPGDSMEPKFPEGVTIVVDPDVEPTHGSFVIALLEDVGQITFKQLVMDGRRYLKPLNPRYPVLEVDSQVSLCGVVKQMIMNFD
jgi:SOS-response transcriptional repressor LexA